MKTLILAALFALPACVLAEEPTALPYNMHEFEWVATSKDGTIRYSGHSVTNFADEAFTYAQKELNRLVQKGVIAEGAVFTVEIGWKGAKFRQQRTAIAELKGELPRGPDKQKELPRGPYRKP